MVTFGDSGVITVAKMDDAELERWKHRMKEWEKLASLWHRQLDMGAWLPKDQNPVAKMDDAPKADYHVPNDVAHRAVHDVTEHLLSGRVTDAKARGGLRDALDKADKPVGRTFPDRALRAATMVVGLRVP